MSITSAAIILFLVLDPLGNIPVFLAALNYVDESRRRWVVIREMVIALIILAIFLFFGKYVLQGMHISEPALNISGGVVLFLIALKMIFPGRNENVVDTEREEPLIVPLAVPMVAGPSAMATLILLSTQYPNRVFEWFLSLLIAWLGAAVILLSAQFLSRVVGRRALNALERLMGMILITMAVQMMLTGSETFILQEFSR